LKNYIHLIMLNLLKNLIQTLLDLAILDKLLLLGRERFFEKLKVI